MTIEQVFVITILAFTMMMFISGRWRHDMVALASLLACVFTGVVEGSEAFAGFGHPAVITVACVLIMSDGLKSSGAVEHLARKVLPSSSGTVLTIAALAGFGAVLSAFMNNVGAMALLIPLAVQTAGRLGIPPGKVLMPLSFGTILGGTTTLIGTPPNLIVSGFRAEAGAGPFLMFDFFPVGIAVTAAGVVFLALAGWRLVPARRESSAGKFDTGAYLTEVRVVKDGKADGCAFRELEKGFDEAEAQILALVRNNIRVSAPNPGQILKENDVLIIEAEPEAISSLLANFGLKLEEDVREVDDKPGGGDGNRPMKPEDRNGEDRNRESAQGEQALVEFVAMPSSKMAGRSAAGVKLRGRYGINLLAISRRGSRSIRRLRSRAVQPGDVLLLQGAPEILSEFADEFGLVPLAKRSMNIPSRNLALKAFVIMGTAVAATAFAGVPAAVSFSAGALLFMFFRVVSPRSVYESVDWSVIVLLGAMLPVAGAVGSSGAADIIAVSLIDFVSKGHPLAGIAVILVVTMVLTDFMNNAATAAVMCPVAVSAAAQYGVNQDAFLMAVAIGASCAFLTPIGHQNNTLILGPGGFRFGDYWRTGVIVEILVLAVSLLLLPVVWPL